MGIRQFRPMTPATRFRSVSDFSEITKTEPEKTLLEPLRRTGGRNNKGHITSRYMSAGHKRQYRRIDFRRDKFAIPARVASVEYDPNRTARIALLHYSDGEKRYILAPKGLNVGDSVVSGPGSDIRTGNHAVADVQAFRRQDVALLDRKSTRLNSSHSQISYAVFCLKK